MKILVCISSVPDTTTKIKFTADGKSLDSNGVQFVINPNDEFGLTRALQLKEANGGSVTVLNVGGADTEPVIRKALAIGADSAVRINATPTDSLFVAKQISEYAKSESFDLILCGKESIDYNGNQVPGMLASLLSCSAVSPCTGLTIEGDKATAERLIDGGKEVLESSLPLVVGGQKGIVNEDELRIPNMRGIMQARTKPLNVVEPSNNDASLSDASYELPADKADCKLVDADNVAELVSLLHNEAKVI
jgi:electron transfer flavoprotein beta subunit